MKNNMLEKGDKVFVYVEDERPVRAVILHTPRGEGDLWGYETKDDVKCWINPYSRMFLGFVLIEE